MAEQPIAATEHDVKDQGLLLRLIRKIIDRIASVGTRVAQLEAVPPPPSAPEIREEIQALGRFPLRVDNLRGELGDPQPAKVTHYDSTPTGLILQGLKDNQLVTVGSTSTGDILYRVIGGNPNTLRQINPTISGASIIEVADASFTVFDDASTGRKMQFSNGSITAGATRIMTIPDTDQILAGRNVNNNFTTSQTISQPFNGSLILAVTNTGTSTGSDARVQANSDAAGCQLITHSSTKTTTRYGITLGSWSEVTQFTGTGLAIGTNIATPLVFGTNNVEAGRFDSSQNLHLEQRVSEYLNETAVGSGVPFIVARAGVSNTSASSTGNLIAYTPPVAGEYRVNYTLFVFSTGTNSVTAQYTYSDGITTWVASSVTVPLSSVGVTYGTQFLHAATSTSINVTVAVGTSTVAPIGTYSFYASLEKMTT